MDTEAVRSLDIVAMKKIFQKPGQKAKNGCQTIVTLSSIDERDLVMGHASNLPQNCSIDLVIPDYLQSLRRYLDKFAYKVRRHARVSHRTKLSMSIHMDDIEQTLYLATREAGESDWIFYSQEDLKDLDGALKKIDEKILEDTEMMEDTLTSNSNSSQNSQSRTE